MNHYKAKLVPDEDGLKVWFDVFKPIHETECFYFCVNALNLGRAKNIIKLNPDKHPVTCVKQSGFIKVYRIAKSGSRIAQPSKEYAVQNLVYRTKLRIGHMKREIDFCESFLSNQEKLSIDYESYSQLVMLVGDTRDVVHRYYSIFN